MALKCVRAEHGYDETSQPSVSMGACLAATMVGGSLVVHHGPTGCTVMLQHYRADNVPGGMYVPVLDSAIHEADLIHGGAARLETTIRDIIERNRHRKPELVWVITGCATSMASDDIQAVAQKMEVDTGIRIIAVDTPAFQGGWRLGCDRVYDALVQNYGSRDVAKAGGKGALNIIGPQLMGCRNWLQDLKEMLRLLQAADVKVENSLTFMTRLSSLKDFGKATHNYLLNGEDLPDFEYTSREHFQVETWGLDVPLPYGIANTEDWYLSLATKFGDPEKARKLLEKEWTDVQSQLAQDYNAGWALHEIAGQRVAVLGLAPFAAAMARCLFYDFNARPVVVGLLGESQRSIDAAKGLLTEVGESLDVTVLENPTYRDYGKAVEESAVSFAIGDRVDHGLVEGLGIPQLPLGGFYYMNHYNFIPWPYAGVRGFLNLLSELARFTDERLRPEYERRAPADASNPFPALRKAASGPGRHQT